MLPFVLSLPVMNAFWPSSYVVQYCGVRTMYSEAKAEWWETYLALSKLCKGLVCEDESHIRF